MSKEITISSAINNVTRIFVAEDNDTIANLLEHDDVLDMFGAEAAEIKDALVEVNGASVPEAIRSTMLSGAIANGSSIKIDLEGIEEEEPETTESAEGQDSQDVPHRGVVTVYTSGGMQQTIVTVTIGETTVYDAIFNDNVRARSGMTDSQLSNCCVLLNGDEITLDFASSKKVIGGEEIMLTPRAASTKGC